MKISRRPPIISIFQKLLLKDLGGPCPVITQNRLAPLLSFSRSHLYTRAYLSLRTAKWMQSLIATGYEDYPEGNPDRTQLSKGSLLRLDFSSRAFFFFSPPFLFLFCPYLARSGIGSTIFTGRIIFTELVIEKICVFLLSFAYESMENCIVEFWRWSILVMILEFLAFSFFLFTILLDDLKFVA